MHAKLAGTTQNDIIKEYLSRGTYVFPPEHSLRLTSDLIAYTVNHIPKWNPINICSYHLQEAGATPVQEIAYALTTAIAVLDAVKAAGQVSDEDFEKTVGRISFFVNAGLRFITETCKMRAFVALWDEIGREHDRSGGHLDFRQEQPGRVARRAVKAEAIAESESLIGILDRSEPQVEIEAQIVQTGSDPSSRRTASVGPTITTVQTSTELAKKTAPAIGA